jgi:hypothetical protein
MARLPEGKQKLMFGCYYTMKSKGLSIELKTDIKWYAWPVLMWRIAHRDYDMKWYKYPRLIWIIIKQTVKKTV